MFNDAGENIRNVHLKEFLAGSVRSEAIKEAVGLKRAKNAAAQETGFSSELSWITAHTASLEESPVWVSDHST